MKQLYFVLQVKWIAFVCILVDRNSTNVAMGERSGGFVLACSVIIRFLSVSSRRSRWVAKLLTCSLLMYPASDAPFLFLVFI